MRSVCFLSCVALISATAACTEEEDGFYSPVGKSFSVTRSQRLATCAGLTFPQEITIEVTATGVTSGGKAAREVTVVDGPAPMDIAGGGAPNVKFTLDETWGNGTPAVLFEVFAHQGKVLGDASTTFMSGANECSFAWGLGGNEK